MAEYGGKSYERNLTTFYSQSALLEHRYESMEVFCFTNILESYKAPLSSSCSVEPVGWLLGGEKYHAKGPAPSNYLLAFTESYWKLQHIISPSSDEVRVEEIGGEGVKFSTTNSQLPAALIYLRPLEECVSAGSRHALPAPLLTGYDTALWRRWRMETARGSGRISGPVHGRWTADEDASTRRGSIGQPSQSERETASSPIGSWHPLGSHHALSAVSPGSGPVQLGPSGWPTTTKTTKTWGPGIQATAAPSYWSPVYDAAAAAAVSAAAAPVTAASVPESLPPPDRRHCSS
ncbi:hypothetical protein TARUN_8038 [Trichoderma arundinaceum]|uniref:Uncharacterized protein n=1 Tax=Trichoderma arundinaceum TaxID=490622 RepID=A0A395NEF2_TRIAR|nr:hypothetical protein TARUN_8038 [Trichoderma arundinaceum]